jgi:hypothetical protein
MQRVLVAMEPDEFIERFRLRRQIRMVAAGVLVAAALAAAFALVILTYNDDPEGQFHQQMHSAIGR